MKTIFISGPMTGLPEWNFPAFLAAAAMWREKGERVINPAENFDGRTDLERKVYIRMNLIRLLAEAEAVYMLRGWEESQGANLELDVAYAIGLEVIFQDGEG